MMVQINPILMKIGDNFVAKHTPEELYHDRAETFALLTAMCWRSKYSSIGNHQHQRFMGPKNMVKYLEMPADLARIFSAFLKTQVGLLKQLDEVDNTDFYGSIEPEAEMGNPTYESIVSAVESRMWGVNDRVVNDAEDHQGDWWWETMMWPPFTFVEYGHQAINKWKLF